MELIADGHTSAAIPVRGGQGMPNPTSSITLDFVTNAVFTGSISWQNLLDTVVMATSTTTVCDVFYSARLKSVEIWSPPTVAGVVAGWPSLAFDSPSQGDQRVVQIPSGPNGGYVKCKPSNHSINGWTWQDSSALNAFTLDNMAVGTVLRVKLVMRSRMVSVQPAASAASGAVTGSIYLRGLDGLAAASCKFYVIPQAYQI